MFSFCNLLRLAISTRAPLLAFVTAAVLLDAHVPDFAADMFRRL
jgi:hypothetical protein